MITAITVEDDSEDTAAGALTEEVDPATLFAVGADEPKVVVRGSPGMENSDVSASPGPVSPEAVGLISPEAPEKIESIAKEAPVNVDPIVTNPGIATGKYTNGDIENKENPSEFQNKRIMIYPQETE